jgi:hypothetical protein
MIVPTVGRIVLYHPGPHDTLASSKPEGLAAIVCYVWGDRQVNLRVFDENGNGYPRSSVPVCQPEDEMTPELVEAGYCRWMEYQVEQAKKPNTSS